MSGRGARWRRFGRLARDHAGTAYLTGVLGPTLLIAVGIGLTFRTLVAATTADVPAGDAGIVGGLAVTANQVGGSIGLAVLASAAGSTETGAAGYDLVFGIAAGLGLAIAAIAGLLPRRRRG